MKAMDPLLPLAPAFERLVPWARAQFPAIDSVRDGTRRIYLDNAAGTLVPRSVSEAMADAALWANPQPSRPWADGPATLAAHRQCRSLLAAFLNAGSADRLFLSESTTSSLYKLREALEPEWGPDDNVVVTDCDHFANVSPWEWRARWQVRRAAMLPDGSLDLDSLAAALTPRSRVVAVTLAGNAAGAVQPVPEAIRLVRERAPEALVVVDAVHAAPHLPIDVAALGADALAFSAYKLFGPNCGVLWLPPATVARLNPYHVAPHTDPETLLEWGTMNNLWIAGITACLEYVRRLGERLEGGAAGLLTGYPRDRRLFKLALGGIRAYEAKISAQVLADLAELPVTLFGPADAARRVPTFSFTSPAMSDVELEDRLWRETGLQAAGGNHYSAAVLRGLGRESLVRASFCHYNSSEEAAALGAALRHVLTT
jgi:selenocysteine lyase/cysteine desulfurase